MPSNLRKKIREKLEKALRDFVERIEGDVLVYGSFVRGDFNERSDIDVIVVAKNLPENFLKRIEVLSMLDSTGLIEVKAYTPEEWERIKNRPWFRKILEEGKVVKKELGVIKS